jgi:tetratricopeptide (TPR) repeat protein
MGTTDKKHCTKCGKENAVEAKFCNYCGQALGKSEKKKKQPTQSVKNTSTEFSSYLILGLAFIFSIVVVLLVLNSNREALYQKLNQGARQQPTAQMTAAQEKIRELNLELLKNPDDYRLNVQIANSYFDIGDYEHAISHYRKALSIEGSDPNVLIDLGVCYFNLNQTEQALDYVQKALQINPEHLQGLFNAGIIHYNLGNYQSAIDMWQKVVSVHRNTPEAERASQFIEDVKQQLNNS